MFDLNQLIEGLKLPTKTVLALCIGAGLLLFAPDNFLKTLGVNSLVNANRQYIGGAFVIVICLLTVSGLAPFAQLIKHWIIKALWIKHHVKRLQCLNQEEKELLAYYITNQTRNQALDYRSGTVNALVNEYIIFRASNVGYPGGFNFAVVCNLTQDST